MSCKLSTHTNKDAQEIMTVTLATLNKHGFQRINADQYLASFEKKGQISLFWVLVWVGVMLLGIVLLGLLIGLPIFFIGLVGLIIAIARPKSLSIAVNIYSASQEGYKYLLEYIASTPLARGYARYCLQALGLEPQEKYMNPALKLAIGIGIFLVIVALIQYAGST